MYLSSFVLVHVTVKRHLPSRRTLLSTHVFCPFLTLCSNAQVSGHSPRKLRCRSAYAIFILYVCVQENERDRYSITMLEEIFAMVHASAKPTTPCSGRQRKTLAYSRYLALPFHSPPKSIVATEILTCLAEIAFMVWCTAKSQLLETEESGTRLIIAKTPMQLV